MKRILTLFCCLLLCSAALWAQRPKNETFTGRVSCAMGIESSAPVTFTVDNTTGDFTFSSKGNGGRVGSFTWKGKMPSVKSQNLSAQNAVWAFQLTEWSDFTVGTQRRDASGKLIQETSRLKSTKRSSANTASGQGMCYDGKKITLNIRIPYIISGQDEAVPVTFTVDLDVSNGYKGAISSAPSAGTGNTVPMPTGTNDPVHINYENGISIGSTGNSPTQVSRASAGSQGSRASTGAKASRASMGTPVSAGGISFALADAYSVKGRSQLQDGEALMISPNDNPDNDRMVLKVQPNALAGINGLTSEEVSDMLSASVNSLAGVIARTEESGYKLDKAYKIHFEDDANCPTAYTSLSGKDKNGKAFLLNSEAVLVNGNIISYCAVASKKAALDDMGDIFREAVAGENDVPQGIPNSYSVTAGGLTFEIYDNYSIAKRNTDEDQETILFVPDDGNPDVDALSVLLLPDVLPNYKDVPADRLSELLKNSTRKLAKAVDSSFKLNDKNPEIIYDDSGLYPIAYTNLKGKNKGSSFIGYVETALVNGTLIGSCALASDEQTLSEMVGIHEEIIGSALRK